jgi:hypothetical protein
MTDSALLTGVIFSLRLLLPGLAASWPLHWSLARGVSRPVAMTACGASAMLAGLALNLLVVLFLGETGWYRPLPEAGALSLLVAGGVTAGWLRHRRTLLRHAGYSLPVAVIFALFVTVAVLVPSRGEWILGGWDPGVYVNEGVALERTGTLHPPDPFFSSFLTAEEQKVFTRTGHGRTERFPGVVVDAGRGAFTFEFFRLMPSMIALACRSGGLNAAVRINTILGGLALLLLASALWRGSGGVHALSAAAILAFQPIWLYHTHIPVSEMLHLVLLLGAALLLGARRNGLLGERLLQIGGVLAAAWVDFRIAPSCPAGWNSFPPLFEIFGVCAAAALAADRLPAVRRLGPLVSGVSDRARWAAGGLAVAAVFLTLAFAVDHLPVRTDPDNLFRLASFAGWPVLFAAAAGGLLFFCSRDNASAETKAFALFLGAVGSLLLVENWIFDVYPWATRRNLPYAIPAASLLSAYLPARLWEKRDGPGPAGKCAALLLLAFLCLALTPKSRDALLKVEYDGASTVLLQVAQETGPEDILVVDDPRWGTPLALIHGKQVLNGKHFWRRGSRREMHLGLRALRRAVAEGRTVRFLTTTVSQGLAIYPVPVEPVVRAWERGPFTLEEIVHSRRATNFTTREKTFFFRLYTWRPQE